MTPQPYPDGYIHHIEAENLQLKRRISNMESKLSDIACSKVDTNFAWYGGVKS
jgi:hypothetical protein